MIPQGNGSIQKLGFIGAGRVAGALARALGRSGHAVVAVSSPCGVSAGRLAATITGCRAAKDNQAVVDAADLVFIATPDDAISTVADSLHWPLGKSVVHLSGVDTSAALSSAGKNGTRVGVFHPLQTFANAEQAMDNLPGTTFALEAEEPLLGQLKALVNSLGGRFIELKAKDKVIYHAAAVMACNYTVTLVKLAADLWQTFGVPPERAVAAFLPLLKGTVNNMETAGIPAALTGPIARGDTGTIEKHLAALEKAAPRILAVYRHLGLATIPVALAGGGIDEKQAARLKAVLGGPAADLEVTS